MKTTDTETVLPIDPTEALEAAKAKLQTIPYEMRCLYTNTLALARLVVGMKATALAALEATDHNNAAPACHIPNAVHGVFALTKSQLVVGLADACALLAEAKTSPRFAEAKAVVEPVLIDIEIAANNERAALTKINFARDAHERKLAEATARALEEAKASPEIAAAREEYEAAMDAARILAIRQGLLPEPPKPERVFVADDGSAYAAAIRRACAPGYVPDEGELAALAAAEAQRRADDVIRAAAPSVVTDI